MQMKEERILTKILYTKVEGKRPKERPRTSWIDQIRKDIEMRVKDWEEIQGNRKWVNSEGWRFLCNSRPINLGLA